MTTTTPATNAAEAAVDTVEAFLFALEQRDVAGAAQLLTDDAEWHNVGLPTVRGREAIVGLCERLAALPGAAFTVEMHNIAAEGDVVLTERTDGLYLGPLGGAFWVCGTFELRDGRIAVWRDRFDTVDLVRGLVLGSLGGLHRQVLRGR